MAVTSFEMDERTLQTIEELKKLFGVKTNAAVLRKSLALSRIVGRHANNEHTVVIGENDKSERVSLAG